MNTRRATLYLLAQVCHHPQYETSISPNMAELSCKIRRFYFSLTLPRICWRKLGEGKKKKTLKELNNLDVPSDWKITLISQLNHKARMKTHCAQGKDIRMISPVGRRRRENHYTSTPISMTIKHMTRRARMLPTYQQEEMESPGFKIYDVMDEKYKDIWGS